SCKRQHGPGGCLAADGTSTNRGCKCHKARTPRCQAKDVQCGNYNKTGHYDSCCKKKYKLRDILGLKADLLVASLKMMVGNPMRIHLKDDTIPFPIHIPRPIPFAFQNQVKERLD
ncbi:hypothetical protein SK128_013188, partial [Halocaridina rubra]